MKLNGLHINETLRNLCDEKARFTHNGKIGFDNIMCARWVTFNLNKEKSLNLSPTEIFLMSLIETILLDLAHIYIDNNKKFFKLILTKINDYPTRIYMDEYLSIFPSNSIYSKEETIKEYIENNFAEIFLEMIQLKSSEENPAYRENAKIFENKFSKFYLKFMDRSFDKIKTSPIDKDLNENLYSIFSLAYLKNPDSIVDQLWFLVDKFHLEEYRSIITLGIDLYNEEHKPIFYGPGESKKTEYNDDIYLTGIEAYSKDENWMPNVVMIAKNALVWLSQLSKKYNRNIEYLNQIPDEELDILEKSGFNALWLIGLWERSEASKKIKQWCGNPEAESSAYSLKSYNISEKLGGNLAYEDLKARAKERGIRLAADMVPNHTCIDSPQVYEHPDWYIQTSECPYPSYSFSGISLSNSNDYGVFLEDHYFDKTDASVVFKYVDYKTNQIRYIYHGNDGTNMPWNDTAQLDYLKAEVRNAVKNQIVEVAKKFNIIRFDAAMTLTKKHFHRLWYPEPGSGGDIPTRSNFGLSLDKFNELFPVEFWREVVDYVKEQVPDTLLLAEAFWLLEGYFVRTLGMHRVYNSAFMNMLRDEDNKKYRDSIKSTLEFDRDILNRYVNFMSNPDEETAIDQFGDGDKYFGICLLMATLPGLPMFAHGQLEGFKEKYGMEYSKSYWDEKPNEYLVNRHKKELFPVLKKRHIFANIENFHLYDFITNNGVDENVFAITNENKGELGLYIYNNAYNETSGYIKYSAYYKDKFTQNNINCEIANALHLVNSPKYYLIYRDETNSLDYIMPAVDVFSKGISFNLRAYEYHLLDNFQVIEDDEWGHYGKLCYHLNGTGVPNMNEAFDEIALGPLHTSLKKVLNKENLNILWKYYKSQKRNKKLIEDIFNNLSKDLVVAKDYAGGYENSKSISEEILNDFEIISNIKWAKHIDNNLLSEEGLFYSLCIWMFLRHFGKMKYGIDDPVLSVKFIKEWKLKDYLIDLMPLHGYVCTREGAFDTICHVIKTQNWTDPLFSGDKTLKEVIYDFIMLDSTNKLIKVNRFDNILWFNKECALILIELMKAAAYVSNSNNTKDKKFLRLMIEKISKNMIKACEESEYKFEELAKKFK